MKFKVLPDKILITIVALLTLTSALRATEQDTLKIEPATPTENDSITVISHVTIPNCCAPYDSVRYESIDDTIIGLTIYHTEVSPACDCYGTCMDTVYLGKYKPGNYRLICTQAFVDTAVAQPYYRVNDMYFTVSGSTGYSLPVHTGESLKVFPVPANNLVFIESIEGAYQYEIINLAGKIYLKGYLRNNRIDISELIDGTYILRIKEKNTIIVKEKIVIRRN